MGTTTGSATSQGSKLPDSRDGTRIRSSTPSASRPAAAATGRNANRATALRRGDAGSVPVNSAAPFRWSRDVARCPMRRRKPARTRDALPELAAKVSQVGLAPPFQTAQSATARTNPAHNAGM